MNDGIDKNWYCGEEINSTYPTIDTLVDCIIQLQPNTVLIFKIDFSRYFRQVPLCPRNYSLIGM